MAAVTEQSAPGSRLAMGHGGLETGSALDRARGLPGMAPYTALWEGGLDQETATWLTGHGWTVTLEDLVAAGARYGRTAPEGTAGQLLTATYP